jgi:hypothetical protein
MTATIETPTDDDLQRVLAQAEAGDATVLPRLRHLLDGRPDLWQVAGDLARNAELSWLLLITGTDLRARECLDRKVQALKAELAGPDPSPLERLLVERITACWLMVHYADGYYAQLKDQPVLLALANDAERRQGRYQSRYLAAIRTLATVRKLMARAPSPLEIATRLAAAAPPPANHRNGRSPARTLNPVAN